jgi:hypothetical protein
MHSIATVEKREEIGLCQLRPLDFKSKPPECIYHI